MEEPKMDELLAVSRSSLMTIFFALALYMGLQAVSCWKLDPREAPIVRPFIPYFGHIVGMALEGGRYVKKLAARHRLPIFGLPMPGSRVYVVTEPSLAAGVQRLKSLSFNPIIPEVTQRILGLDSATVAIVRANLEREGGIRGFVPEIHDMVYSTLAPGDSLDKLATRAAAEMANQVQEYEKRLQSASSDFGIEDLLLWTQHFVTIATARFLYGPENPIAVNPALEAAFWDFDHGIGQLLMNIWPSVTARKAFKGREALAEAFTKYLKDGHHRNGSRIIQHRIQIAEKHGFSQAMVARSELSFLFAGIVNTATTSFWMILHIFARPELLKAVREELLNCLDDDEIKSSMPKINTERLKGNCPLFISIYRETLRVGSDNSSTRLVTADTLLADQFYLRKDSIVQISGGAMHSDEDIWGADANEFNPRRFIDKKSNSHGHGSGDTRKTSTKGSQAHPAAFRAFGGGATLCPGRHFATNEITYFVALIVLRFEIEPLKGTCLKVPRKKDNVLPVHILEPVEPVQVKIRLRDQI